MNDRIEKLLLDVEDQLKFINLEHDDPLSPLESN
jgi:hypothetical protein